MYICYANLILIQQSIMRKFYFLLFAFMLSSFIYSQELLLNGGFENWTGGEPDDWSKFENTTQESTEVHSGSFAAKQTASGTKDIAQTVTGITPGTSYTVSIWYKVLEDGNEDGTDARIWSKWSLDGTVDNTTDADVLQGPGNAYLDNNGFVWTEYSVTVTAPATANEFYFEVRSYGSATVFWDDFSFFQEAGAVPTLTITSPTNGASIPSSDVDVVFNVQNFVVGNPGAGIDGHLHYFLDGNGPTMVYDTNPISLTGLAAGSHTFDLELVDNNHQPLADPVTASVTFDVVVPTQVNNLADLRAGSLGSLYELTNEAVITYIVTDNSRNQKYIQDATGAILIDDSAGTLSTSFNIGDGITGLIGELGQFSGVLQFVPSENIASPSSTGNVTTPEEISVSDFLNNGEDYESELIKINNVTFSATGVFEDNTNYDIADGADVTVARVSFGDENLIGANIPAGTSSVIGLGGEFNGTYQILPRYVSDVEGASLSVDSFTASTFNMYPNPVSNGFLNITSASNEAITVTIYDILGKRVLNSEVENNTLNVSSLNAGIYVLNINQNGNISTKKLIIK